jgi:hypothetical protein
VRIVRRGLRRRFLHTSIANFIVAQPGVSFGLQRSEV